MNTKKILALALALMMLVGLTACKKETGRSIQDIKDAGVLVVGTSADYPPYEFHTEVNGVDTIVGFDIDIARYFADQLGVELKIVDMPFDSLLISLQEGEFDLVMAGMSPDEERMKAADFTDAIASNDQIVIIRTEDKDKYTTIDSLKGHKVGAQTGSAPLELAKNSYGEDSTVALVKNQDLIMELLNGKIDAVQATTLTALPYVSAHEGKLMIQDLGFPTLEDGFAGACQKGSTELVEFLNKCIADMKAQGLIDKYIADASILAGIE